MFKIMDGKLCYAKGYYTKELAKAEIARIKNDQEGKIMEEQQVLEDINNMTIEEDV